MIVEQPAGASTKIDIAIQYGTRAEKEHQRTHACFCCPGNKTQPGKPTCQEQDYQLGSKETFSLKRKAFLCTLHSMKDNTQGANSFRYKCSELKQLEGEWEIEEKSSNLCVFVFSCCKISFLVCVCVCVYSCSLVGLKLINLACFCLCIILLSVYTMTNP